MGIYVRATPPSDGGTFQYALAMLRAAIALPADRFEVVVASAGIDFARYFPNSSVSRVDIALSRTTERLIGLATSVLADRLLPLAAVRRVASIFDSAVKSLEAQSCDLWLFPAGDPIVYRSRLRAIVTIHDLMHRYEPRFPEVGRFAMRVRRDLHYRALCAAADTMLVDSPLGAQHVTESYGVDATRIAVLPYSAPDYSYEPPGDVALLPELPPQYFYYPAQYWPHKNHLNLARAVRVLVDRGLDPYVVLSGGAPGTHLAFTGLVRELGIVGRFTELGYVPNEWIPALYRRSSGLVFPSYFGPTNIPPLEALLCSVPVAASGNYGMPAQLGDAAICFDPDNPESIADAMQTLLTDPKKCSAMIVAGEKRAKQFRFEQFADRLRSILTEKLEGSPQRQSEGSGAVWQMHVYKAGMAD